MAALDWFAMRFLGPPANAARAERGNGLHTSEDVCKLKKTGEVGKKVFATPLHFPLAGFQIVGQAGRKMDRMMVSMIRFY